MFHFKKDIGKLTQISSFILVSLVLIDMCEIWILSGGSRILRGTFDIDMYIRDSSKINSVQIDERNKDLDKSEFIHFSEEKENKMSDWFDKKFLKKRKEKLKKLPINQVKMIEKLLRNPTIQKFCTNDLRKKSQFSKNTFVMVSNYTFLLRICFIHIVLVALPYLPGFQLSILIILEISYLSSSVFKYKRDKHLKSIRYLIVKVWQSLFLLSLETIIAFAYMSLEDKKSHIGEGS